MPGIARAVVELRQRSEISLGRVVLPDHPPRRPGPGQKPGNEQHLLIQRAQVHGQRRFGSDPLVVFTQHLPETLTHGTEPQFNQIGARMLPVQSAQVVLLEPRPHHAARLLLDDGQHPLRHDRGIRFVLDPLDRSGDQIAVALQNLAAIQQPARVHRVQIEDGRLEIGTHHAPRLDRRQRLGDHRLQSVDAETGFGNFRDVLLCGLPGARVAQQSAGDAVAEPVIELVLRNRAIGAAAEITIDGKSAG